MTDELTAEEREFMLTWHHAGGIFGPLTGDRGAKGDAEDRVAEMIAAVAQRYPNRSERLMILAALSEAADRAKNDVLDDIIESSSVWVESTRTPGELVAGCLQDHEMRGLASLARLTGGTIRRRQKAIMIRTYNEAKGRLVTRSTGEKEETTCRICGELIYEFQIGTWQHIKPGAPEHNAEPTGKELEA